MKKKIILFYPKTEKENINRNLPLALLAVGSPLAYEEYDVRIFDSRRDGHYKTFIKNNSDNVMCFGVSVMTGYQIYEAMDFSSFAKKLKPDIPVVWGGWHPSILPEQTMDFRDIDILVRGQGEETFRELIFAIDKKRQINEISGITYRCNGKVIRNSNRDMIDMNNFVPMDTSLIDIEKYLFDSFLGTRTLFWVTSYGCPFHCTFCCSPILYPGRWTGLNAERVVEQLRGFVEKYEINAINFVDNNFFVNKDRVMNICKGIIDNNLKIYWGANVRIDQINNFGKEMLTLLKRSGCRQLFIGAESGDEDILKMVSKNISIEDTYKAAGLLSENDIVAEMFIMVGFPDQPEKDLGESLRLIKDIKMKFPNHQFTPFLYTPYPGTKLFRKSNEKGLKIPVSLKGWIPWTLLSVRTPWIDNKFLDRVNSFTKFYFPLAFPSESLKKRFQEGLRGYIYKFLHRLERYRVERNFFLLPLEWSFVKNFYRLKLKLNIFKGIKNFR